MVTISQKMARILEETKPEAAYFCAKDGKRGGRLRKEIESNAAFLERTPNQQKRIREESRAIEVSFVEVGRSGSKSKITSVVMGGLEVGRS
jgi:hypothetical protein